MKKKKIGIHKNDIVKKKIKNKREIKLIIFSKNKSEYPFSCQPT